MCFFLMCGSLLLFKQKLSAVSRNNLMMDVVQVLSFYFSSIGSMESVSVSRNGHSSLIVHPPGQTSLIAKSWSTHYHKPIAERIHGGKKQSPTCTRDSSIVKHGHPYLACCPYGKVTRRNREIKITSNKNETVIPITINPQLNTN